MKKSPKQFLQNFLGNLLNKSLDKFHKKSLEEFVEKALIFFISLIEFLKDSIEESIDSPYTEQSQDKYPKISKFSECY